MCSLLRDLYAALRNVVRGEAIPQRSSPVGVGYPAPLRGAATTHDVDDTSKVATGLYPGPEGGEPCVNIVVLRRLTCTVLWALRRKVGWKRNEEGQRRSS